MDKLKEQYMNDTEFQAIISDILANDKVQYLENYIQHYTTTRLDHSLRVAYISYRVAKKHNLNYTACARGGLLHDFFLYDWRNKEEALALPRKHAFIHPQIALETANKYFELTEVEQDIIVKHMWPVTLALPKYIESYIVSSADKYSASYEILQLLFDKFTLKEHIKKRFQRIAIIYENKIKK